MKTSVLVVDDTESARHLIAVGLGFEPDFEIVGEAEDAASALDAARRLQPDVVILDVEMPGQSGLDAVAQMRGVVPDAVILLHSAHQAEVLGAAIANGADGVLEKGGSIADLAGALRDALSRRPARP